jgi:hypothetical protein
MKRVVAVLLVSTGLAGAEVIPFKLENGLSPVVPPPAGVVVPSTGSGDAIESGLWFDTEARTLTLVIGYGSAAGFADLTGPATAAHIHDASGVVFDLWGQHFANSDPARGGIFRGVVTYGSDAQVEDLLNGRHYVNVHTAVYPAGEISGDLVRLANGAPILVCPEDVTLECVPGRGTEVSLRVIVSDPEGDAVRVVWRVDGEEAQVDEVAAGQPGEAVEVVFTAPYSVGTHLVTVTAADAENQVDCQAVVQVIDTRPPMIRRVWTDQRFLWPPNHKMVPVKVNVRVDDCQPVTWRVVEVTSNEPVNGRGDGNTSPDWIIANSQTVYLRAERSGLGNGRVYTIKVAVTDAGGLTSHGRVAVAVPHDMGRK